MSNPHDSADRKSRVLKRAEFGVAVSLPSVAPRETNSAQVMPATTSADIDLHKIFAVELASLKEQARQQGIKLAEKDVMVQLDAREKELRKDIDKQLAEHHQELAAKSARLDTLIVALEQSRRDLVQTLEPTVIRLTQQVIHKVIGVHAETHSLIVDLVKQAITAYEVTGTIKVRVSPKDYAEISTEQFAMLEGRVLNFVSDSTLKAGACVLDFDDGMLDIGLPQQLSSIQNILQGQSDG